MINLCAKIQISGEDSKKIAKLYVNLHAKTTNKQYDFI